MNPIRILIPYYNTHGCNAAQVMRMFNHFTIGVIIAVNACFPL